MSGIHRWKQTLARLARRFVPTATHLVTGRRGERAAAAHLRQAGYRLLGRNLRRRQGEIDLLAQAPDGRTIVVVEVKARLLQGDEPAGGLVGMPPEVHVNAGKRRKLVALAVAELRRRRLHDRPVRFDVIGVDLPRRGRAVIRHHVAAFSSHI